MRISTQFILLILMQWLAITPCLQAAGRKLAVVVGVNSYRTSSGLPDLKHATSDAHKLSEALRKNDFTVYEMTHEIARKPGQEEMAPNIAYVRDQIDGVLGYPNLGADDAILITLHGHGVQFDEVDDQGNKTPRFYFCPADATIANIELANELTERNHLLPLDELYKQLGACGAATKLLIVDACRNDPTQSTIFKSGLASSTLPKLPPPPGGTAAFFSCKSNQRAVEDPVLKQGVFTHFLVQGLLGEADLSSAGLPADGKITLSEISAYVANNVYAHVYNTYKVKQSPELRGNFDLNLPLAYTAKLPNLMPSAAEIEFVKIEPGSFTMGSHLDGAGDDEAPHRVTISKSFYAGKYEVTVGQVMRWLNSKEVEFNENWIDLTSEDYCPIKKLNKRFVLNTSNKFGQSEEQPMVEINWHGAKAFCDWCSGQDPNFTYRLPTEAEWEYFARAGSTSAFPWGNSLNGQEANIDGNSPFNTLSKGPFLNKTTKVGSYRPNAWGLHDTVGNVYEWCNDWYDKAYYANSASVDPQGPASGDLRVLRGGAWEFKASSARSSSRFGFTPNDRFLSRVFGFRVVAE